MIHHIRLRPIATRRAHAFVLLIAGLLAGLPAARAQGSLDMTGSVALANLMTAWAQAYNQGAPEIPVSIAAPGGAAGAEALLNGTADIVLLGAPLTTRQRQRFVDRHGYPPKIIPVAMDGIAVFVHRTIRLERITLQQLDAVYSRTRYCGAPRAIDTWRALGLKGRLAAAPIHIAGLDAHAGAYHLFKRIALCNGDFRDRFQALVGPADVAALIRNDTTAMGFAGSALRSADLRPLAIARTPYAPAYLPTPENIRDRRYPLSRTLNVAINVHPGQPLPTHLQAFLAFVRSPAGQAVARKAGYVALPGQRP